MKLNLFKNKTVRAGALSLMLAGAQLSACVDLGVAVKNGAEDYAGLKIDARAQYIYIKSENGFDYRISWKGTNTRGNWCIQKFKASQLQEYCVPEDGNVAGNAMGGDFIVKDGLPVLAIRDNDGKVQAGVRLFPLPNKMSGTEHTGPFFAILKNQDKSSLNSFKAQSTWLRFAYGFNPSPDSIDTNDIFAYQNKLSDSGVLPEQVKQQRFNHRMYVDLFQQKDGGISEANTIKGSMLIEKSEYPFMPRPRGAGATAKANLNGVNYVSEKDAGGCSTTVVPVGAVQPMSSSIKFGTH